MRLPSKEVELQDLGRKLSNFSYCPKYFWAPIFKGASDNIWMDVNNESVAYTKWRKNQPNGGNYHEKCAGIAGIGKEDVAYFDTVCSRKNCFYCSIRRYIVFKLQGFCEVHENISVDAEYVLQHSTTADGMPTWRGFKSSFIRWNGTLNQWEISDGDTGSPIATSKLIIDFPFGQNIWYVEPGICKNVHGDQGVLLMFSRCTKFEFSCSDGTCIPLERKCDYVPDCWDESDEQQCSILNQENLMHYKKDVPDISVSLDGKIIKKEIAIAINITSIEKIEVILSTFTAHLSLEMEWSDSRLTWQDLKGDQSLNFLNPQERHSIWFPIIYFENTENKVEVPNDEKSKLLVKRNSEIPDVNEKELIKRAYFQGAKNPLIYSREFHLKLKCDFKLRYFPFDKQECYIIINAGYKTRNFVHLVKDSLTFSGEEELATFDIIECEFENGALITVKIVLKRRVSNFIIKVYIPSIFIMIAAQVM